MLAEAIETSHTDCPALERMVAASPDYRITCRRRHLLHPWDHQGARTVNVTKFL